MSHELLDKERTFPCARAVSEAKRRNCTKRLGTDFIIKGEETSL